MADLSTKPRSGRLPETAAISELVDSFIQVYSRGYRSMGDFAVSGTTLSDSLRAVVAMMRIPYPPYYDTSFILKYFKTANHVQPEREQVELEAASLHHAAEAFRRNNNISRSPRVYNLLPEQNLVAMERIHARGLRDSPQTQWSKERMIKFVRQMAARNFWGQINRGPFPNRHEMILASLRRDQLVFRWMRQAGQKLPPRSKSHSFNDTIEYLEKTIENIEAVPRPTRPEFFSLNHNDLQDGFNAMVRGSRVVALIDWEAGSYDPLSTCIRDLAHSTDFNPRVWREHAGPNGENFHVLPYRLQVDPIQRRLALATQRGAERKPFPDWELIENIGGPLGEEDFCGDNYPEDISSDDDESIVDAAEMHCDSDVDAEEEWVFPTAPELEKITRKTSEGGGVHPCRIETDWHYEPVYALIREFIHHQRGAGLGPDGEWGRLPEEYSRPLAEWEDPLFMRVTQNHFIGVRSQLIDEERADDGVAQAAPVPAPTKKVPTPTQNIQPKTRETGRRQRRVPTLIGVLYDDAAVGAEVPPESTAPGGSSAYLGRNRPRRVRPKSPPTTIRKTGRDLGPIPRSALHKVQEPRKAKQWAVVDHPPVEAPLPDDDILVKGVRDCILAKVMEKLRVGPDSGRGVL
ncbi:hypothetical protein HOY82DRAFT_589980 [Tuber indicum]|nr:hypothetical protein HOY82DRAFT_589980 [Tuber indicum]